MASISQITTAVSEAASVPGKSVRFMSDPKLPPEDPDIVLLKNLERERREAQGILRTSVSKQVARRRRKVSFRIRKIKTEELKKHVHLPGTNPAVA